MCIQHQRPAKPQKKSFRTIERRKHTPYDSALMEHGDPNFVDMRIKQIPKKKKGFFEKFFS